jgi:predicted 3-demethylubiquinone-9 3-methyltransferase (glyoxalase superfamily)
MQKIVPHLWYDDQAEEAAKFYVSLFENSEIKEISRYPKAAEAVAGRPAGSVMTVAFQLNGQDFLALNGGPVFKFNESVSFLVNCDDQAEIDRLWEALTADGGEESQCGWLKDRWGLSWQIVPTMMPGVMTNEKAMAAFLQMKKINIAELEAAGKEA